MLPIPGHVFSFAGSAPFDVLLAYRDVLLKCGSLVKEVSDRTYCPTITCVIFLGQRVYRDNYEDELDVSWNLVGSLLKGLPIVTGEFVRACQSLGYLAEPADHLDPKFCRLHRASTNFNF